MNSIPERIEVLTGVQPLAIQDGVIVVVPEKLKISYYMEVLAPKPASEIAR